MPRRRLLTVWLHSLPYLAVLVFGLRAEGLTQRSLVQPAVGAHLFLVRAWPRMRARPGNAPQHPLTSHFLPRNRTMLAKAKHYSKLRRRRNHRRAPARHVRPHRIRQVEPLQLLRSVAPIVTPGIIERTNDGRGKTREHRNFTPRVRHSHVCSMRQRTRHRRIFWPHSEAAGCV